MKYDDEIIQTFIEEAQDLLQSINNQFNKWQTSQDPQLLSSMLRDLHTFKGSSRMVGFVSLSGYIHALEQVVQKAVTEKNFAIKSFNEEITFALDFLSEVIEKINHNQDISDLAFPNERLLRLMGLPTDEKKIESQSVVEEPTSKKSTEGGPEIVRVKSSLFENFSKLSGVVNITRSHIEQQVMAAREIMSDMTKETKFIHEQMRYLQIKTDANFSMVQSRLGQSEEFDVLELDRYSFLQQSTRLVLDKLNLLEELGSFLANTMNALETALIEQTRATRSLDESIMHTRMVSVDSLVERLKRTARQVARELNKEINFECIRVQGEADRKILEKLTPALEHMVRNAVDHGIENQAKRLQYDKPPIGSVRLSIYRQGNEIIIELSDDGSGFDLQKIYEKAVERKLWVKDQPMTKDEALRLIMLPGFSTKDEVTPISGRGVGMDVVIQEINELGGSLTIETNAHIGSQFIIRLPFSLSLNQALIFNGGEDYALLLTNIHSIGRYKTKDVDMLLKKEDKKITHAREEYALYYLAEVLGNRKWTDFTAPIVPILFLKINDRKIAFVIDHIIGSREIVIKPLGFMLEGIKVFSGVSLLGDGRTVLVLNAPYLVLNTTSIKEVHGNIITKERMQKQSRIKVLVTDDSITVRQVTSRFLRRHQYTPLTAKDGLDALNLMTKTKPDVVLLDIEMPRMDGFEVIETMRANPDLKDIPVIMITSRSLEKHRFRAMQLGASAYLTKPYREDQLLELLQRVQPQNR